MSLKDTPSFIETCMGTICLQSRDPHFRLWGYLMYALQQSGIDAIIIIALSYQILLLLLVLLTTTAVSPVEIKEPF